MINFKIVTPVFNADKHIAKCIDSVKNQTYAHWSMIVVCDGCTDNTHDVAVKTAQKDNRIDIVNIDVNKGHCHSHLIAHNKHVCNEHDVFVHLDGDDFLYSNTVLEFLFRLYSKHEDRVWATYGSYVTASGRACGSRHFNNDPGELRKQIRIGWPASHLRTFKCFLWKHISEHDLTNKHGVLFPAAVDVAIFAPILEMCGNRIAYIKKPLYHYNDNLSGNVHNQSNKFKQQIESAYELADRKPKLPLPGI
tara:strand:+ start:385 stop:1134 length:750 start_codon:yes stop_codon:yes gene_type:complete